MQRNIVTKNYKVWYATRIREFLDIQKSLLTQYLMNWYSLGTFGAVAGPGVDEPEDKVVIGLDTSEDVEIGKKVIEDINMFLKKDSRGRKPKNILTSEQYSALDKFFQKKRL